MPGCKVLQCNGPGIGGAKVWGYSPTTLGAFAHRGDVDSLGAFAHCSAARLAVEPSYRNDAHDTSTLTLARLSSQVWF